MNKDGSELCKPSQERVFREITRPPWLKVAESPSREIALILSFGDENTNGDEKVIKYPNRKGSSVQSQRKTPTKQLLKRRGDRNYWKGENIKNKHVKGRNSESTITEAFIRQMQLVLALCSIFIPNITTRIILLAHVMEMYI